VNEEAKRERNRLYYEANAEALREAKRRYREDNAEAVREADRRRYAANVEAVREAARRRYAANVEARREAARRYSAANAEARREAARRYREANPEAQREADRRYCGAIRATVLGHYSPGSPPCCACCGTTEKLAIDHVDGNGTAHRMEIFGAQRGGVQFYRWLIAEDFPAGYQVLCMRCNASKGDGERCQLDHAVLVPALSEGGE
jgi:hypothetical protein